MTILQRYARDYGHRARKRKKYGLWHSRHYWHNKPIPQAVLSRNTMYRNGARVLLLLLLSAIISCTSVGAMQVSHVTPGYALTTTVPDTLNWQHEQAQMVNRCTSHFLQLELSNLQPEHFCAAADNNTTQAAPKWYTADPSALDQLNPDGTAEDAHVAAWSVHPTGKWVLGNHP
jgi:hypothetical protein